MKRLPGAPRSGVGTRVMRPSHRRSEGTNMEIVLEVAA
jgi:hypothetical protein